MVTLIRFKNYIIYRSSVHYSGEYSQKIIEEFLRKWTKIYKKVDIEKMLLLTDSKTKIY